MDRVGLAGSWRKPLLAMTVALLAACGGGGGSGDDEPDDGGSPAPAGIGAVEAARLLTQATFGPTSAEISRVSTMPQNPKTPI